MDPAELTEDRRSSRIVATFAEVKPAPVSVFARALEKAARAGAAVVPGSFGPSFLWSPRSAELDANSVFRSTESAAEPNPNSVFRSKESDELSFAGWGTAARIEGFGEARFEEVEARAERLWSRLERAGSFPIAPRLFGGFAFDASLRSAESSELALAWAPFGDAVFVLPRLLFASTKDRAWMMAFAPDMETATTLLGATRRVFEKEQQTFESEPFRSSRHHGEEGFFDSTSLKIEKNTAPVFDDGGEAAWHKLIRSALSEIQKEVFQKVVLCRTRRVTFERTPDLLAAFGHLEASQTGCARFFFEQDGTTFLGATPERLLRLQGRKALTEALAGSYPRREGEDDNASKRKLLESEKDRAEHAFVTSAIREALLPVCETLSNSDAPCVRSFAHLHHLATPITGMLSSRAHLLSVAARLHPTPALCGFPRSQARRFLLENEPEPRGFYGGGIGWFDMSGDGEIAVAIRSALVRGRSAAIYAGAGIVGASDPAMEYAETTTKERAMREALEAAS